MDFNRAKEIFFYAFITYLIVVAVLYVLQRQMIYYPDKVKPNLTQGVEEVTVTTSDGLAITGWHGKAQTNKPTIIFFHGNAGHYGHRIFKTERYVDEGFGFVLAGYRGYGGNAGKPTERGFYNDARAYIRYLLDKGVPEDNIILYGESIGTGVAVQMATEFSNIKALILESPYTSLPDVAATRYFFVPVHLLMKDRFDNLSKIKNVSAPLFIIQGLKDRVIPPKFGQKLFQAANEPKEILKLEDHGHNDMPDGRMAEAVIEFLQE